MALLAVALLATQVSFVPVAERVKKQRNNHWGGEETWGGVDGNDVGCGAVGKVVRLGCLGCGFLVVYTTRGALLVLMGWLLGEGGVCPLARIESMF